MQTVPFNSYLNSLLFPCYFKIINTAMVDGNPVNPRRVLMELQKAMPKNAIVTTDIGNVSSTANSYLKFTGAGKHIAALTFGNTGFAPRWALSSSTGSPGGSRYR